MLSIIDEHDPAVQPLFLLFTPHVAHCPLQSPPEFIDEYFKLTAEDDEGACEEQTRPTFCPLCRGPTDGWPQGRKYQ